MVNRVVETLANAPKQEEHKLNLRLIGFEAKEGETKKELMQWLNTKLSQGQMRLRVKVLIAIRQRLTTAWASALATNTRPGAVLPKFITNEDHQAVLWRRKGLTKIKLGLDDDLTPTKQARNLELWPLFKEAKVKGKCAA